MARFNARLHPRGRAGKFIKSAGAGRQRRKASNASYKSSRTAKRGKATAGAAAVAGTLVGTNAASFALVKAGGLRTPKGAIAGAAVVGGYYGGRAAYRRTRYGKRNG